MAAQDDRRIIDSLESGLLWFDTDLRIVDANRAAREVLGLGPGPLGAGIDDLGSAGATSSICAMPRPG